jgi:hypothetical protein
LVAAQRRDELDRKISEAENKQGNAPAKPEGAPAAEGNQESATPITSADPLAEQVPRIVKWVTRGTITPSSDDVVMLRILWLTVPPVLAGVFLMLATALWAPPRTKP